MGGPGSTAPPAAARASLSPSRPAGPFVRPEGGPIPPAGCASSPEEGRRRAWEERGGAGRAAECRGGSCDAPGEEPLGDPRRSRCAAAAPGRADASPLAVSAQRGGGARLSGGEGRGRAGAGPERQQAARGSRLRLSRRRNPAGDACAPGLGNAAQGKKGGRVGRKESANAVTAGDAEYSRCL